jgi:DNA-binding MarR family transcriptional regulator
MSTTAAELRTLARFRHAIRKFLHVSEEAVRTAGVTPQHHQLLLGIAAFTGKGWATIGELAQFLQVRHHSAVGLVDRAESSGLVRRQVDPEDRREVRVLLTAEGIRKLRGLADLHHRELLSIRRGFNLGLIERETGVKQRPAARRGRRKR